jgi:hypothetical protein
MKEMTRERPLRAAAPTLTRRDPRCVAHPAPLFTPLNLECHHDHKNDTLNYLLPVYSFHQWVAESFLWAIVQLITQGTNRLRHLVHEQLFIDNELRVII